MPSRLPRRSVLVAGTVAAASLAGCSGGREPQKRTFTLTISRTDQTLHLRVDPAGDVQDVIRVYVGDTVEFVIVNEADVAVGFHNHATDAEFIIDPGDTREESFEASEAMTGRQEIEGWVIQSDGDGSSDSGHHPAEVTTIAIIEIRPRSG